ncbi:GntR family transcriptional regulator [Thalassobacillus sp. CUG 92003]|uniref:GntR family transcriptional regulator n=1 Tax=Thalassobacillus sp. CUG 92003 TaxID=2736641 RepID=UPI0015E6547B|nr:GntR family transcriptional regulator [Thalassobacillus sp. CUG 92003]
MGSIDLSNNALSNHIAEHITNQIITGKLQPGEKLVENNYAEEYGTSRAPVREAIFTLTVEGLVERVPRRGAIVKEYTESEIYDLLEIRIMLESLAIKRINENGVDEEFLKEMEAILRKMQDQKEAGQYAEMNHDFHMCIIKMSKSDVIKKKYDHLKLPLLRIQSLSFAKEGNIPKSINDHAMIVQLLKEKEVMKAANALNQHNQDVISNIQNRLYKDNRALQKF